MEELTMGKEVELLPYSLADVARAERQQATAVEAALDFIVDRDYWKMDRNQRRVSAFEALDFSIERCARLDQRPLNPSVVWMHYHRCVEKIELMKRIPQRWRKYYTGVTPAPLPVRVSGPEPLGPKDIEKIWALTRDIGGPDAVPWDTPNPLAEEEK